MSLLPTPADADAVRSLEDLSTYVQRLHAAVVGGEEIENASLDRFLEALAAWVEAAPTLYRNIGQTLSEDGDWSFFAHALSAALIYE